MLPDRIGRYGIVDRLGSGGMGVVYRAIDPVLHRDVAIKVLAVDRLDDPQARTRFYREARAAAQLQHQNIVTVYEFVEGDSPYLVMELLHGSDLERRLTSAPTLTMTQRIDVVSQLCSALACAHDAGIVHRDVKPSNVWIQPDGRVKLLDFGIARFGRTLTTSGDAIGSTPFMAPEQFRGGTIDGRTDVFAVGVVLYQLLTGSRPFDAPSSGEIMLKILSVDPRPLSEAAPDLPEALSVVSARALQKQPQDRYQTIAALADDLRRAAAALASGSSNDPSHLIGTLYIDPIPQRSSLEDDSMSPVADSVLAAARRRPVRLAGGVSVVAIIITALAFGLSRNPSAEPQVAQTAPPLLAAQPPAAPVARPAGQVVVRSDPPGASIEVDGRPTGHVTPTDLALDLGQVHHLRLTKPGFAGIETEVTPTKHAGEEVSATLRPLTGRASVSIRGSYPFEVLDGADVISPASAAHEIKVNTPKTLRVRASEYFLNQPLRIEYGLAHRDIVLPRLGRLTIRARENCRVSIGGQLLGYPPINRHPIAPGTYSVELACPQVDHRIVTVAPGGDTTEVVR